MIKVMFTDIYKFADKLNGREYRNEMTLTEEQQAKELGFVVLFGSSDDLAEFRGAYEDERDCFDGGRVFEKNGYYINAVWCEGEYEWTYKTNIPHATFDIFEDGEKYCKGIVFERAVAFETLARPLESYLDELTKVLGDGKTIWLDETRTRKARRVIEEIRNRFGKENVYENEKA